VRESAPQSQLYLLPRFAVLSDMTLAAAAVSGERREKRPTVRDCR